MKGWFLLLMLTTNLVLAQCPIAEVAQVSGNFWPLESTTGAVHFTGPTAHPLAADLHQAEHLRAWLTSTCSAWTELQTQADSTQRYQGQLRGVHVGVVLRFAVRLQRQPSGWQYHLLAFQVGAPTGEGLVQYVPLAQVLADSDYRADVVSFQQQLQRALPQL
jgi:hypothetical protein